MHEKGKRIGVVSDTHGLLRPEAVKYLNGADIILHSGDAGKPEVLEALSQIAPLYAVRGNVDKAEWANKLPITEMVEVDDCCIYVIHDLHTLDLEPSAAGIRIVVSGHSHKPQKVEKHGVLYFNPGSAGPRRFDLPVSIGEIFILGDKIEAKLHELI